MFCYDYVGYIVLTTRTYPSFFSIERLGLSPHGEHSNWSKLELRIDEAEGGEASVLPN